MNLPIRSSLLVGALCALLSTTPLQAQHAPPNASSAGAAPAFSNAPTPANVYAPYEVLIGDWDVMSPGKPPSIAMHFKWAGGPRGYILFNTSLLQGEHEETHFEGILIWNELNKNLDMLLSLDPTSGRTQEKGTVRVEPDGTIVREIVATGPQAVRGADGKPIAGHANFRQTFKVVGPNEIRTKVMRETKDGWVPTFPGSDDLVMRRRTGGSATAAQVGEHPRSH